MAMCRSIFFVYKHIIFVLIIYCFYLKTIISIEICRTPNGESGECISIKQCSLLLSMLEERPRNSTTVEFLRQSQCGYEVATPKVCCPVNLTDLEKLLPDESQCGIIVEDNVAGGETAGLDEFPWVALIRYEKKSANLTGSLCSGSLINNRYIVTAGHCLYIEEKTEWKIIGVRLGEYDTSSDIDCLEFPFTRKCAPATYDVGIEEIIRHENFTTKNYTNNIGLLRLAEEVTFSDFIQPACLPKLFVYRNKKYTDKRLYLSGWGTEEGGLPSTIKLKLAVQVWNQSACNQVYNERKVIIDDDKICAGGELGKDSCGSGGNPLMAINIDKSGEARWYVVGVVSFGLKTCGTANFPSVYTNVGYYIDWIIERLRP